MKLNSKLITNNYFFIGFIIILVGILTLINNFYFYEHVKRSAYRNASQLGPVLQNEIEFCRKNRISGKRYRENIETLVKKFANNAYYNDTIILKHEEKGTLWEKPTNDWDKVVASHIEIILPKLKSDNHLYYNVHVKFDGYLYFISVIRSMTFSIFDKGTKFFNSHTVTEDERKEFYALRDKLYIYESEAKNFNELIGKKYGNGLTDDEKKSYAYLQHELLLNKISDVELESYEILKSKIKKSELSNSDIQTAWFRSRPAIGFTLFAIILALLFRRRELQRIEIEKELKKEQKNKEMLETIFGPTKEKSDISILIEAIMNKDISKLKDIKSVNPTMNIIEYSAMVDHTEEEKLKILEVLIEKGIDLNFHDEDGMTALMYYAIGNVNNEYDSKIIETLTKNGIDINAQNKSGMTALMLCAVKNRPASVQILIDNGADKNIRHNLTAKELAATEEIRNIIIGAENHTPQRLVQLLSNFTIDGPMKYTVHEWDFNDYYNGNFDEYTDAVKKQFESMESELQELSSNLYEKIRVFLIEENPAENYSWCSKTHINIGWSSLDGLREWCDKGKNPFDFVLKKPISYEVDFETIMLNRFEDIINLFKQEIEARCTKVGRIAVNYLHNFFADQIDNLGDNFMLDLSSANLNHQFYTDTEKLLSAVGQIFGDMQSRANYPQIKVTSERLGDSSIEIKITQIDSTSSSSAKQLLDRAANLAGNISEIKKALNNLCDWSIESSYEEENFRVNFLHSNNVNDIEILNTKPKGFTHILRFYK